jgi:hypothetical protein
LSSLSAEKDIPKALASRTLGAAHEWVAKMSPARFVYVLVALGVIIAGTIIYVIFDRRPDGMASGPITVWISEMPASTDPNDTPIARTMVRESLDIFDVKTSKPTDVTGIVMTIQVGCYSTKESGGSVAKELRIRIPELKWDRRPMTYETVTELPSDQIVQEIRTRIFEQYPPEGTIYDIRDLKPETAVPAGQQKPPTRKVYLDVGFLAGVRERDVFQIVPSGKARFLNRSKRIEIDEVGPKWSMAIVSGQLEIEEGWGAKWIKAGY